MSLTEALAAFATTRYRLFTIQGVVTVGASLAG